MSTPVMVGVAVAGEAPRTKATAVQSVSDMFWMVRFIIYLTSSEIFWHCMVTRGNVLRRTAWNYVDTIKCYRFGIGLTQYYVDWG